MPSREQRWDDEDLDGFSPRADTRRQRERKRRKSSKPEDELDGFRNGKRRAKRKGPLETLRGAFGDVVHDMVLDDEPHGDDDVVLPLDFDYDTMTGPEGPLSQQDFDECGIDYEPDEWG